MSYFRTSKNQSWLGSDAYSKSYWRNWLQQLQPIHWVKNSAQWYVFQRMNSWCQLWQVGKVWWEWYVFQRMKIVQNCLLNEWILVNPIRFELQTQIRKIHPSDLRGHCSALYKTLCSCRLFYYYSTDSKNMKYMSSLQSLKLQILCT